MPYIKSHQRLDIEKDLKHLRPILHILTEGEHNYLLTQIILGWIGEKPDYRRLEAAIGRLEMVKQELTRRVVVPYEEGKCRENGDVFE